MSDASHWNDEQSFYTAEYKTALLQHMEKESICFIKV